jgi:hypothetical protein
LAAAIALACVIAFVLYGRPGAPARPSLAGTSASGATERVEQRLGPTSLPSTGTPTTGDVGADFADFAHRETVKVVLSDRSVDEALFKLKYREPSKFVGLDWHQGVPYKYFRSIYAEKDAPEFLRLLSDDRYAEHWPKIAKMIGYLGTAEGTAAIVDYVRREEDLSALSEHQVLVRLLCKVGCLDGLGIIGTEEGVKILRSAVTDDGAAALAAAWINRIPDSRARELFLANLQGAAARGLVLTQTEQNVSLVRDLYDRQKEICQRARRGNEFMSQLVDAMCYEDSIEEHGRDAFLNLLGDDAFLTDLLPRVRKYKFTPPK